MKKHRNWFGGKRRGSLVSLNRKAAVSPDKWRYQFESLEDRVLLAGDTLAAADLSGIRSLLASATATQSIAPVAAQSFAAALTATQTTNSDSSNGLVAPQFAPLAITPLDSTPTFHAVVSIKFFDVTGTNQITTAAQGNDFLVEAFVQDTSTPPAQGDTNQSYGVFSAYTDVTYNRSLAAVTPGATFTYGSEYTGQESGDTKTPGLINEAGATTKEILNSAGTGAGQFLLWSIKAHAAAAGQVTFTPGPANLAVNVFRDNANLSTNELTFNAASLTVTAAAAQPVLSIHDASISEGSSGTTNLVFTVDTPVAPTANATFVFSTADGTATTANNDYVAASNVTTTLAAGTKSTTITVAVKGDTTSEPDETLSVILSNPSGNVLLGQTVAVGTILNDDNSQLSINNQQVIEGNGGTTNLVFTVSLTSATGAAFPVTVQFATADGTATLGDNDYTQTSGTLTFQSGDTTKSITVPVIGDTNEENDETFVVNLTNPTNANIQNGTGTGTIKNDDTTVSIASVSQAEGNTGTTSMTFNVSLSKPTANQVTVLYATADGTNGDATLNATSADSDYVPTSGTVTFAAGQTTPQTITVTVNGDKKFEKDEQFSVTLSGQTNATLGTAQATGTIQNDDGLISVDNPHVLEGNVGTANMVFTVTLNNIDTTPVTVAYGTADGSATDADNDYEPTSGSLTFLPGDTSLSQQVTVAVNGDTNVEGDETFKLQLSNPSANAAITTPFGTGTILSDDLPTLSIGDFSAKEGDSGQQNFVFAVTLSQSINQDVTVHYFTQDGTATAADNDFIGTSGILTFAANGATSQSVTVKVVGDTKSEADETFTVKLDTPTNATIPQQGSTGTGTIEDDPDPLPSVSINAKSQAEGNSGTTPFVFNVTLSTASGQQVTVQYATQDGSNADPTKNATTADSDYTATSGTLTFAPGVTSQPVTVSVNGDHRNEDDESFNVLLSNGNGKANIVQQTNTDGVGTIVNDDQATVTINDVAQNEGDTGNSMMVFTVTMSNPSTQLVTVTYHTVDGTATILDNDYIGQTSTVTFQPGDVTQTISIPIKGDTKFEPNETFQVQLDQITGPTGNATVTLATKSAGTGTINNDDAPPSLAINSLPAQNEGDTGTTPFVFTVTLTGTSSQQITVQYATANGNNADTTTNATTANNDYQATSGTLTFAAGATGTQTITVQVVGDLLKEKDETFLVNLSNPTGGAVLGTAQGSAIIHSEATDTVVDLPSTISGFVFVGATQTSANGLGGQTITLTGTDDQNAAVNRTATTLADGSYTFSAVLPGQYTLTETQPTMYTQGHEIIGSGGGTNPAANQLGLTIASPGGLTLTNYNFDESAINFGLVSLRLMMSSTPTPSGLTQAFVTTGHVTASSNATPAAAPAITSLALQATDQALSQEDDWLSAA